MQRRYLTATMVLLVLLLGTVHADGSFLRSNHATDCSKRLLWFMSVTTTSCPKYCRHGTVHAEYNSREGASRALGQSPNLSRGYQRCCMCLWFAVKIALLSAKEHSPNLLPILLVGNYGGIASPSSEADLLWFQRNGGIVYHHNLSFINDLQVIHQLATEVSFLHIPHTISSRLDCANCATHHIVWLKHNKIWYGLKCLLSSSVALQAVQDKGMKPDDWPIFDLEGVYMRLDIPKVVPHLMKQLDIYKSGMDFQSSLWSFTRWHRVMCFALVVAAIAHLLHYYQRHESLQAWYVCHATPA